METTVTSIITDEIWKGKKTMQSSKGFWGCLVKNGFNINLIKNYFSFIANINKKYLIDIRKSLSCIDHKKLLHMISR